MKRIMIILPVLILAFSLAFGLQNQEPLKGASDKKKEPPKYLLNVEHKSQTFFTFKMIENTDVTRFIEKSGTERHYSRDAVYFLTARIPESPEEGFETLEITLDSLNYTFKDGDAVFTFDSRDLSGNAARFRDLNMRTASIGRMFELTYSPYGEVAKISGSDLEDLKKYIKERGEGYLSPIDKFMWDRAVSFEKLSYYGDMKKIILPKEKKAIDSVWRSPISLEINGYYFHDTVQAKINDYNAGIYRISAKSTNISPDAGEYYMYDVKKLVGIDSCKGEGTFNIDLKASGYIMRTEADYDIEINTTVGGDAVTEKIKSNVVWERLKTYRL